MLSLIGAFSNLFFLQILIGALLFTSTLQPKSNYKLRLLILTPAFYVLSIALYEVLYLSKQFVLYNTLYYFLVFISSFLMLQLLYKGKKKTIFFCASVGYLVQHISSQIVIITRAYFPLPLDLGTSYGLLIFTLSQIPIFIFIYVLFYFLFGRNFRPSRENNQIENILFLISFIILFTVELLSSLRDYYAFESQTLTTVSRLFSILCCLFLLLILVFLSNIAEMESEKMLFESLYQKQQEQFQINKETIDLINEKCHDMRHQLSLADNSLNTGELKELINIYDNTIRTNNPTLDTIFAEKSILCQKYGIRLSPIIDGEALSFLDPGDICSLFGNLLENAMEAVIKLANQEDRIISVQVQAKSGMIFITSDNYYNDTISLNGGLPQTTKDDHNYHGFGVKSMERIAKKYGGTLTVTIDEMFHLIIAIPQP